MADTEQTLSNENRLGGFDADTYAALHVPEPQPVLAGFAGGCPVQHTPSGDPFFVQMAGIRDFVQDPSSRSLGSTESSERNLGNQRPLIPLQIEGDLHRQYRRLLDPLFSPKRVATLEPAVRALADELIDSFIERGEVDLYTEFCAILPATVFVRLMGIPDADVAYFMEFKNDLLRSDPTEPREQAQARFVAAGQRCYKYFDELLRDREASGAEHDDLVGLFMTAEVDGRRLTHEDILDITYLLMIAGLDTVAASLSCFLSWLARHPEDRRQIVADPAMWPAVVEELLRYETPVPMTVRFVSEDVEIEGVTVPSGTSGHVSWAAGNLDPDVFSDPLTVDFTRERNPHLTFGAGTHRCLGSHLARMELRTALDQFHRRIPEYRIQPGQELHYEALPVRLVNPLPLSWDS